MFHSCRNADDSIKVGRNKIASTLKRRYKFEYVMEVQMGTETPTVSSIFQKLASQPALRGIKVNALALTFALKNWEYCGTQKVQISSLTDHFDPHRAPATFSLSPLCFQQCLPFILLCFEFPSPTLSRVNVSPVPG